MNSSARRSPLPALALASTALVMFGGCLELATPASQEENGDEHLLALVLDLRAQLAQLEQTMNETRARNASLYVFCHRCENGWIASIDNGSAQWSISWSPDDGFDSDGLAVEHEAAMNTSTILQVNVPGTRIGVLLDAPASDPSLKLKIHRGGELAAIAFDTGSTRSFLSG